MKWATTILLTRLVIQRVMQHWLKSPEKNNNTLIIRLIFYVDSIKVSKKFIHQQNKLEEFFLEEEHAAHDISTNNFCLSL